MKMENLISSAYTYIEFNKDFENYCNDTFNAREDREDLKSAWESVLSDYKKVSAYMDDNTLKQAYDLVMSEF